MTQTGLTGLTRLSLPAPVEYQVWQMAQPLASWDLTTPYTKWILSVQTHAVLLLQVQTGDHLLEVGSDHEGSWAVLLFAGAGITTASHLQVLQIQL